MNIIVKDSSLPFFRIISPLKIETFLSPGEATQSSIEKNNRALQIVKNSFESPIRQTLRFTSHIRLMFVFNMREGTEPIQSARRDECAKNVGHWVTIRIHRYNLLPCRQALWIFPPLFSDTTWIPRPGNPPTFDFCIFPSHGHPARVHARILLLENGSAAFEQPRDFIGAERSGQTII